MPALRSVNHNIMSVLSPVFAPVTALESDVAPVVVVVLVGTVEPDGVVRSDGVGAGLHLAV